MEGYPHPNLSTLRGVSLEPSRFKPNSSFVYEIRPALIELVQESSFSGLSHENPYNHVQELSDCVLARGS